MIIDVLDRLIARTPPQILGKRVIKVPRALFDWKKRLAFTHIVRYAYEHSSFYRRRFDELKIDPTKVKTPQDLGNFYTMPQDIVEHAEDFLCRPAHIVFESSGTTGRNKRVYYTQDELDDIGRFNATGMFFGGIRETDRLVNAFDFNIWIPGMVTQKGLEKARVFGMAAGKVDPMEVYKRIPIYGFNIVFGEPTWLIKLTEIAEKLGSYPLRYLVGGAEAMPDAARPWMEKVWQGAKVRMVYACVESGGTIAFEALDECKSYHINENGFFVEIVNPDAEGYGEIAFTTLLRKTMPLIRYRNRDISKIDEEPCSCGLAYRKLAGFRGRADELVVASGGNLYPKMFEEILSDVEGISNDWQIAFRLKGIKEVMEFHLESEPRAGIKENILKNIQIHYPDLWKNYGLGIFETDFIYHPKGSLRKNRKLMRILDKRYTDQPQYVLS